MPEVIIAALVIFIFLSPQIIAGVLARSMGRRFWFWISFLIPIISIIILLNKKNLSIKTGYKLAELVKKVEND